MSTPDWRWLVGRLDGRLYVRGQPGYDHARRPAQPRHYRASPAAVLLAESTADVVATLQFARECGLRTSTRSGGHCFAGRSSSGDVIIDVSPLHSVAVSDAVSTVGAGMRLGALADVLALTGRTLPMGTDPSVGITGLTLGGGFGLLGRKYGLTCDSLLGARVVLADGRIVDCDVDRHANLFWALRGAGGGHLGVVTGLRFATVSLPEAVTCFRLTWPVRHAVEVIDAWQHWAPTAHVDVTAELRVTATTARTAPVATVFGAVVGCQVNLERLLDGLIAHVDELPDCRGQRTGPYPQARALLDGLSEVDAATHLDGPEYSKGEFFAAALPRQAIDALLTELTTHGRAERQVTFSPWGGAYNRPPADATAFAHRDELFLVEHLARVLPATPAYQVSGAHD